MYIAYWTIVYGGMVLLGGVMGYVTKKSKPSLIAGGLVGLALIGSGWLAFQKPLVGTCLALALTLVMVVVFVRRYRATGKFMPAGMVLALSILSLAVLIFGLVRPW